MKPTMAISVCVLAAGLAAAQNPSVVMNGVRNNTASVSSNAPGAQKTPAPNAAPSQAALARTGSAKAVQSPSSAHPVHAKKPARTPVKNAKSEKSAAPKVEPMAPKKVGEIVGSPAPGASADGSAPEEPAAAEKYAANGKRDPFVSPVVAHATGGSGCSTGKKCLEIGSINLRGVVHSENGFIAVVSNSLNKAYFLRENDPVFNGYVVKITGDSIIFQETLQDRLGKTFTREVTKKITVPAV